MQKQVAAGEKIKVSGFRIIGQDIYPEETLRRCCQIIRERSCPFLICRKGQTGLHPFSETMDILWAER